MGRRKKGSTSLPSGAISAPIILNAAWQASPRSKNKRGTRYFLVRLRFPSTGFVEEVLFRTQHLITTIPHPGRDNWFVKPFGFHSVVHDTTSIGFVVEDILDGHSWKRFTSTSFNLLTKKTPLPDLGCGFILFLATTARTIPTFMYFWLTSYNQSPFDFLLNYLSNLYT